MSDEHHAPEVHEAFLMTRHLKLEDLDADRASAIAQEVGQLLGVDSVVLDSATRRLDIAYDASLLGIEQVEDIIRRHGSDLDHGWWTRFKESWYRFTDQNAKENARHEPGHYSKKSPRKR